MDCSQSGSSAHGILQARLVEWVAMSSFRGQEQDQDCDLLTIVETDTFPGGASGQDSACQ